MILNYADATGLAGFVDASGYSKSPSKH